MQDTQIPRKSYLTEKEQKVNQYLDKINHAPYFSIFMIMGGVVTLFTMMVLLSVFWLAFSEFNFWI